MMIEKTKKIKIDYPSGKIMLVYTLLGSYIGGVIAGLSMLILEHPTNNIIYYIESLLKIGFVGVWAGFIPAFLASSWISVKQLYKKNIISYIKLFFIGFLASLLFYSVVAFLLIVDNGALNNGVDHLFEAVISFFSIVLLCSVVGGLSSVIVGSFVVPKVKQSTISESTNNDSVL